MYPPAKELQPYEPASPPFGKLGQRPRQRSPSLLPKIDYIDHQQGWAEMGAMFSGLRKDDLLGAEAGSPSTWRSTPTMASI